MSEFLNRLTSDVAFIQQLGDNPNFDNNMSAEDLKAWFDKAPEAIKAYINETLIPQLENKFGEVEQTDTEVDVLLKQLIEKINYFEVGTGFLPIDGGVPMTGNLNLSNNRATNVALPIEATDAANRQYVDSRTNTVDLLLSKDGWSADVPHSQTLNVPNQTDAPVVLVSDYPFVDVNLNNVSDQLPVIEGWGLVGRVTVSDNDQITAYCYEDIPEVDVPFILRVVR